MPLLLGLISGAVLLGALALCAVAWLSRGSRRVLVETEGRHGQADALPRERQAALRARTGGAVMAPEATTPGTFSRLNKTQAEELLDWLQAHGHVNCELTFDEQTGFTVRCR